MTKDLNHVQRYVEDAIKLFVIDPPDSDFQAGYLDCLITIWKEALGKGETKSVADAKKAALMMEAGSKKGRH